MLHIRSEQSCIALALAFPLSFAFAFASRAGRRPGAPHPVAADA
jgi:hypothetical protein